MERYDTEDRENLEIEASRSFRDIENIGTSYGEVIIPSEEDEQEKCINWKTLWAFTGPGFLMSIAYLDPGNLESDLQAGAYTGYQLIWVLFAATALGLLLQILAVRLGVVSGKNLAQHCRQGYSRPVSLLLWCMTELAIIGSDIQEVIGSAIAFRILFGLPLWAGALITGLDTFTFLFLHAFGVRKLEAFFGVLIATMCVCFFVDFGYNHPGADQIFKGFIPGVSSYAWVQAVGLIGAVIMPHNIYLHSALVQSRQVDRHNVRKVKEANKYFSIEAGIALFLSFLINLAVLACFGKGFFADECASQGLAMVDGSCQQIGLLQAGDALEGLLGGSASKVWAVGLLAAGQSSTMTGTYAGQFVMEGFLDWKLPQWKRVAITRSIALVPALMVALASSGNDDSGDVLDEWLNVLQSIQLPFAILPLLHFTSETSIMGEHRNGRWLKFVLWAVAFLVLSINIYLVVQFVSDPTNPTPDTWWFYMIVCIIGLLYFMLVFKVMFADMREFYYFVLGRVCGSRGYSNLPGHQSDEPVNGEDMNPERGNQLIPPVSSSTERHQELQYE